MSVLLQGIGWMFGLIGVGLMFCMSGVLETLRSIFGRDGADARYWRKAYEDLVKQTGRDLNDGFGIDPRKAAHFAAPPLLRASRDERQNSRSRLHLCPLQTTSCHPTNSGHSGNARTRSLAGRPGIEAPEIR